MSSTTTVRAGGRRTTGVTVVVPVHNEVLNVGPLLEEVEEVLSRLQLPYEMVVVDDGSSDGTVAALQRLRPRHPGLRVISLARQRGQSAALDAGFRASSFEQVITMDGDLQNDPADIPALLSRLDTHDAVCGRRARRQDSWLRRLSSAVARWVRQQVTHDGVSDTGCSLKAFRGEVVDTLPMFDGAHRFLPALLRMQGRRVTEIDVNHRPRLRGRSKYGVRNRLFRGLHDLIGVHWLMKRALDYQAREVSA